MSYLLTFLAAWFYCTLFHELAHAFFAKRRGAAILRIVPYWHWHWWEDREPRTILGLPPPLGKPPVTEARFRFAGYFWQGGSSPTAIESLAPVLMDGITVTLGLLSMLVLPWGYGAIFIGCAAIDASVWTIGYLRDKPGTDGHKFRRRR